MLKLMKSLVIGAPLALFPATAARLLKAPPKSAK
jgi:hypothetical protein